ncbi:MAG: hypothetical protein BGO31_15910 [Bacteroidetes bacterium 43-16]|nr:MAG: hypothetical protein BGO31_15910 [Bacteroidetes bacterium 43-16]
MAKFIKVTSSGNTITYTVNVDQIARFYYSIVEQCVIIELSSGADFKIAETEKELEKLLV